MIKVADFGLSQVFAGEGGQKLRTQCGTPNYMGPELSGNEPYEGPPADIYAMGVMLFLITQAQFPFSQAGDVHYRRLHKDSKKAMQDRKLEIEEELLDLIVGMTKADPNMRYKIADIQAHAWFKGETATAEQMCQHFYDLMGKTEEAAKALHEQNQTAKSNYMQAQAVNRSHVGPGLSVEEFDDMSEKWSSLDYYSMSELNKAKTKGFHTKVEGLHIFSKLYRFIENDLKEGTEVYISDNNWKMRFSIEDEIEAIESESEEEGEAPLPKMPQLKPSYDVEVRLFGSEDQDEDGVPEDVYVEIRRLKGDVVAFGNFAKRMTGEKGLQMFVDSVYRQQE